jgi:hypothetical protein
LNLNGPGQTCHSLPQRINAYRNLPQPIVADRRGTSRAKRWDVLAGNRGADGIFNRGWDRMDAHFLPGVEAPPHFVALSGLNRFELFLTGAIRFKP